MKSIVVTLNNCLNIFSTVTTLFSEVPLPFLRLPGLTKMFICFATLWYPIVEMVWSINMVVRCFLLRCGGNAARKLKLSKPQPGWFYRSKVANLVQRNCSMLRCKLSEFSRNAIDSVVV